jgi:predicted transcriptional regulator
MGSYINATGTVQVTVFRLVDETYRFTGELASARTRERHIVTGDLVEVSTRAEAFAAAARDTGRLTDQEYEAVYDAIVEAGDYRL